MERDSQPPTVSMPADDVEWRLFGILCTCRRPDDALRYLDLLEQQTLRPDFVVVVDNGSDPSLAATIANRPSLGIRYRYLDPGENLGPAGAFRLGFEQIEPMATERDLIAHFDDDDPPVVATELEALTTALRTARATDPSVAGMALSGGVLSRITGIVSSSKHTLPYADVDHLHGGYLPTYTVEALVAVRSHDPSFFFGFEELELGRRLFTSGRRLLVDNSFMDQVSDKHSKKAALAGPLRRGGSMEGSWSRFHKERNLIRILRREGLWLAIAFTVVIRHILRPLMAMPRDPKDAWRRLVLGLRATRAGLSGSVGIDPRYPPPSSVKGDASTAIAERRRE